MAFKAREDATATVPNGDGAEPAKGSLLPHDDDTDSIFGDEPLDENGSQYGGKAFSQRMGSRGLSDISEEMSFELRVLEVVLDYVTAFMEHLTSDLEAVAYPGLDAIVVKVRRGVFSDCL